ncbi:multidrug resistance-associated protein 1-like [Watersipora subatra]|uniref:multidrug resistance-associated protein 1-like n=1 Tax=Watersipora subatra TaxID=2589382 RepID=UPI00355C0764
MNSVNLFDTGEFLDSQSDVNLTSFERFCGSVFWNNTLTWNTVNGSIPDFTRCFQETVTSWVPCGFFWICLPFYLYYLSNEKKGYVQKLSPFIAAKSIICLLLATLSIFDLGYSVAVRYNDHDRSDYTWTPAAAYVSTSWEFLTMLSAAVLTQWYRMHGKFTSGVLWCYWLIWCFGAFIPFYSEIVHLAKMGKLDDLPELVSKTVFFTLCLVQFILASYSDANQETQARFKNICPEELASFSSYLAFSWFTSTVKLGYQRDLNRDDLWQLGPKNTGKGHVAKFEADWNMAVAKWRHQSENLALHNSTMGISDTEAIIKGADAKEPPLSLAKIIAKHYGGSLLIAFACKFVYDWIQFMGPLIQRLLMEFVGSRTDENISGDPVAPVWQGYVLTLFLFSIQIIMSILFQQLWYISAEVGFRVRASIISIIYKKALKLSSEAKLKSTSGEIVNLMSVDAQRMQDVFTNLWMLWSAPLQIALALWQLFVNVGASIFVGFALMVIAIPLNAWLAMRLKNVQGKQMQLKDTRVKILNEVLGGIKVIKLYAWEPSFEEKVSSIRKEEMKTISSYWVYVIAQYTIISSIPIAVTAATYATYIAIEDEHILNPTVAFLTLTLFNILRAAFFQLPVALSTVAMAAVSIDRIRSFFKTSDLSDRNVEKDDSCDVSLRITHGTFSWCPDTHKILQNVNFEVPTGSLTAVVGQVGSGKSSLLAACVGDMHKHSGIVVSKGQVAFVAQQAWIQNATVKDNILFGKPFDQKKYDEVVDAVALRPDFKILDYGDMTMIGEKGINLSGGQKQRVSLARACYSDSDLYLFDDPLSAVDAHVGKHIFEQVIGPNGLLKGKTRVLVTHGVHWLPDVDNIVVLSQSRITETGSYDSLLAQKGAFAQFVEEFGRTDPEAQAEPTSPALEEFHASSSFTMQRSVSIVEPDMPRREFVMSALLSEVEGSYAVSAMNVDLPTLTEADQGTIETVKVTPDVYKLYAKAIGYFWLTAAILSGLGLAAAAVVSSIWLAIWTDDDIFLPGPTDPTIQDEQWTKTKMYLGIFCVLAAVQCLAYYGLSLSFAKASISASSYLHEMLLKKIMKAQMSFFDTRSLGQILNRFSKDIDAIDNILGTTIVMVNMVLSVVIATVIIIIYSTPIFVVLLAPFMIFYYLLQRYFIYTVRQLKRWEAITRSPIFTHFSETVTGAQTIRAFGVQKRFIQKSEDMVEENVIFFYGGWAANRWLAVRLQTLSGMIVGLAAGLCVLSTHVASLHGHISSSIAGLSLSYALLISKNLDVLAQNLTDFETNVVSIERVKEYSEVPLEADWDSDNPPPRQWPGRGAIQFRHYATRYRPGLDLVLKQLDFSIKPQEKVGIVGRTGAGKSSMTVALFRLIEAARGSIYIDGLNIGAIGLHQLRNKLTILPQDPVLFSGSMRENLDPFRQYSDERIWEVLEQSYLKEQVERSPEKLEADCGEGGKNLSVGQRQLVCLARALLRKTKILVLDEATAAVDLETDDLIQKTIRTAFADCTILTIAHRLNTIMDSDRILVLDKGMVAEFDTPENLLRDDDSVFSGMAKEAGLKAK